MTRLRPLDLDRDRDALVRLDTAFSTGVVLAVAPVAPLGFALVEQPVRPPLGKRYRVRPEELAAATECVVAERDRRLVGVAALTLHPWNGRAELSHLYVDAASRGAGVGAGLLGEMRVRARALGARCLWVETQNVNAPAIGFYQRQGFTCCGLDTTLYDPRHLPGETAVFFALGLA
jgi:ribosomal protein S18 acetylase RimI-like enzyme